MMSIYAMLDENDNFGTTIVRQAPTLVFRDLCSFCDNPRATYHEKDKYGYTVVYSSYNRTYVKIDDNGEIVATGLIMKCPECGKVLFDESTEHWKNIEGHPWYDVSSQGRVRSYAKSSNGVIGNGGRGRDGYMSQSFADTDISKKDYVHRLVATAFIPNPYSLRDINHKNHVRDDNRVSNIEWCSPSYNNRFVKHPRYNMPSDVILVWKDHTCQNNVYHIAREVAQKLGVSDMALSKALRAGLAHIKGYNIQLVKEPTLEQKRKVAEDDLSAKENSNTSTRLTV